MIRSIAFILVFFCYASTVMADMVVVVNKENNTTELTKSQIIDLFMGRHQNFPNGETAFPIDHPPSSETRAEFYRKLVNKSVAEVNAYWARLLFTGRASPPRVFSDSAAIKKAVSENRGGIGYIDSSELDDSVKVISYAE